MRVLPASIYITPGQFINEGRGAELKERHEARASWKNLRDALDGFGLSANALRRRRVCR